MCNVNYKYNGLFHRLLLSEFVRKIKNLSDLLRSTGLCLNSFMLSSISEGLGTLGRDLGKMLSKCLGGVKTNLQ